LGLSMYGLCMRIGANRIFHQKNFGLSVNAGEFVYFLGYRC
jgi:hypothetical protein